MNDMPAPEYGVLPASPGSSDRSHSSRKPAAGQHPIAPTGAALYIGGMNSSLRHLALLLLATAFLVLVTAGCQTSKGFGKDVEKLGDKIQEKSK
jgi:predicted small secreted protein